MPPPRQRAKSAAAAFPVPQTKEAVDEAICRIGILQRDRIRINTEKDEQLAAIDREHKARMVPLADEIIRLQQGIQVWCEANRQTLTQMGKVKFHNFPSGAVKWRMRPPKVVLRSIETVLDALRQRSLGRFIRVKPEVDKEEILKDREAVAGIPGIKIEQVEDFVVEPFETKLEEVV